MTIKELKSENRKIKRWKKSQIQVWGPVLSFCIEHAEELQIGLGESISSRVLEIL